MSSNAPTRPHRWTAARRVQLAVSASVRQLASPTTHFEKETKGSNATITSQSASLYYSSTSNTQQGHPSHWEQPWTVRRDDGTSPHVASNHRTTARVSDENEEIFINLEDMSTTNIDDALRSLHDGSVRARCCTDGDDPSHDDSWWWDDSVSSSSRWDRRNMMYAQSQCVEHVRELHADPLEAVATSLLAEERERAQREAEEGEREQELQNWNAFPNDAAPSLDFDELAREPQGEECHERTDEEFFGDFQSADCEQTASTDEAVATSSSDAPSRHDDQGTNVSSDTTLNEHVTIHMDDSVTSENHVNSVGDSSVAQEAKESYAEPLLTIARSFSDDTTSGDASSVIRQADDWLHHHAAASTGFSPTALSASSSLASVDTPDLVQWTDRVLHAAAAAEHSDQSSTDPAGAVAVTTLTEDEIQPQTLTFDDTVQAPGPRTESPTRNLTNVEPATIHEEALESDPSAGLDVQPSPRIALVRPIRSQPDSYVPLSLQLPVDDLSSLEARFTRRRQQRYNKRNQTDGVDVEADTVIRGLVTKQTSIRDLGLPSYYFTNPNLDDTASLLESLPWKYVLPNQDRRVTGSTHSTKRDLCHIPSPEDLVLWDESTTSRLCDLDAALDMIQSEILKKVQPHEPTLERANSLIHEFEQNLRLGFMYWERSTTALELAAGADTDGLAGPGLILQTWQQREEIKLLSSALLELDEVWARERDLFQRIDNFDVKHGNALEEYYAVIDLAKSLEDVVNSGRLAELRCLEGTRRRLPSIGNQFWQRLLEILTAMVIRCCRQNSQFEWIEYERLVKAVRDLHSQTRADHSLDLDFAEGWVERILSTISYETERCLAVALLKPCEQRVSSFEQELRALAGEVDAGWGDRTKIQGIVHNLVTIRFDLESHVNYLPGVMQRLFALLTEVLHTLFLFVQWHSVPFDDACTDVAALHKVSPNGKAVQDEDLSSILALLSKATPQIWDLCEAVVAKCLDEYIHFAKKTPLFKRTEDGVDDTLWADDLDALREVSAMADVFGSLKHSFQNSPTAEKPRDHSPWTEKLSDLFRRHLRAVHVDAMNTIGRRLSNESWILGGFSLPVEPERTELPEATIDRLLYGALIEASRRCARRIKKFNVHQESEVLLTKTRRHFAQFQTDGNPFNTSGPFASYNPGGSKPRPPDSSPQTLVHTTMNQMIAHNEGTIRLAPEAVTRELVAWFARLLAVMESLPLIAEDVSSVFANVCDLYFTTALRLCAGNEKNERLLLGIDDPSPFLLPRQEIPDVTPVDQRPQMFSPFRGAPQRTIKALTRPRTILPSFLDAEICSPLPRDKDKVESLRTFIERAQKSLRDVVNLSMVDAWMSDPNSDNSEEHAYELTRLLTKRLGAIWSCFAVAGLVDVVVSIARCNLECTGMSASAINDGLKALEVYGQTTMDVIPELVKRSSQIACTRAVAGSHIVKDIVFNVGTVWEESKLHESCNEYIDELCYRNALIWGYLTSSVKFPEVVLKKTWETLLSSSYQSLLEGFSRVQYCSTEGRSLMALDVSIFAAGMSPSGVAQRLENIVLVHKPPLVTPECHARHVEAFVKVYYYPTTDAVAWIAEHRLDYKLNQVLSLVVASYTDHHNPEKSLTHLMEQVKLLYRGAGSLESTESG